MRYLMVLSIISVAALFWKLFPAEEQAKDIFFEKMNGVSLVSPRERISSSNMGELKEINANWVAVIPYAFARSGMPQISFDHERQWWGERTDGTCELISIAKSQGLKVMLKPHVWVRGERWAGDFDLDTEEQWVEWEKDFTKYILRQAKIADSMHVEILCIGTEYRIPARERPQFWRGLIQEVRKVYAGGITYASNWDNYENITWWDQVDYIGIDAYFPLVEERNPTVEKIEDGWQPIENNLARFSKKWKKKILFTEYGFQSVDGAAGKHWEVDSESANANEQIQSDAYEATFKALMHRDWYAGGFFWKWYFHQRSGDRYLTDWTPQNKLAEGVITKWYGTQKVQANIAD